MNTQEKVKEIKENIRLLISKSIDNKITTKAELAVNVDVTTNTIRNILKGKSVNLETMIAIDVFLNLGIFGPAVLPKEMQEKYLDSTTKKISDQVQSDLSSLEKVLGDAMGELFDISETE